MLKQFKTTLQNFSKETLIRNNFKTIFLSLEIEKEKRSFKTERIKDYFNIQSGFAFKSEDYEEEGIPSIRIGDVGNNFDLSNMVFLPEEYKEKYKNYLLKKDDIVVGLTGDGKLKVDYVLEDDKYLLNQRVGALRKKKDYNLRFLYLLLDNSTFIKNQFLYLSNGKTQLNISPFDFLQIKIPNLPLTTQNEIVSKIEPIEQKIKELKATIKNPKDVINLVFTREFGFDLENADKKKQNFVHYSNFVDFANEEVKFDISLKYRYIFNEFIKKLSKNKWLELGKIVDVKGGKRLPKGQNVIDEDTGYKYVRVDDLSPSGIFNLENIKYITEENHLKIKNYISKKNDILLTIVGATVGKCGLVPEELDGENITENFARIIIKNKKDYSPEYINYCLQSKTSVYQIDEYKGRASQGKLALFRIKKIIIPDISLSSQQKIVDEIKLEIDKQEQIKKDIEKERRKIDELIEKSIK